MSYSRLLLKLRDKENALSLALRKQEIVLSQDSMKDIKKLFNTTGESTESLSKPVEAATQEYGDSLKKAREDFKEASAASKEKAIRNLDQLMINWQNSFTKVKERQEKYYEELISKIQMEIHQDQESTLDQRLLSQNLVDEICNLLFFMYFEDCSGMDLPSIEDSYEERARKLSDLKWTAIQQKANRAASKYFFLGK